MAKLIIIVGLPGSGKSYYFEALKQNGIVDYVVDDFHAKSINDIPTVPNCRCFSKLEEYLTSNKTCAISDIRFCNIYHLAGILDYFHNHFKNIIFDFVYFDNSPLICKQNVMRDTDRDIKARLENIAYYSPQYIIPNNIEHKNVFKLEN